MNEKWNKIHGLLIGCAYGDAMGMPSEMMNKKTFSLAFPDGIHSFMGSTQYDFINRKFRPYEVTDDTINTLILCDSIIKNEGYFILDDYLDELIKWKKNNKEKSQFIVGPSTKKALELIKNGVPITETGKQGTTNGSCMKASPLGIICDYHDIDTLIQTVHKVCLPTHNTNIAITCTSIIVGVVSYFLRGETNLEGMWNLIFDIERNARNLGNQIPTASLIKRLEIVKEQKYTIQEFQELFGAGMECIETLPMVFEILMETKFEPKNTALAAANLFGDTDTIGSIATAIAGIRHFTFSRQDILNLELVNNINFEKYADKLVKFIK